MNNIKHRHLFFNMKYYHDFDFFTAPYCSEENLPMKKRTNVQGLKQYANSFAIDTLKVVFNTFKYNRSDFTVIEGIQREFIKGMI